MTQIKATPAARTTNELVRFYRGPAPVQARTHAEVAAPGEVWRRVYARPMNVRFESDGLFCPMCRGHLGMTAVGWTCRSVTCRASWDRRGESGRWLPSPQPVDLVELPAPELAEQRSAWRYRLQHPGDCYRQLAGRGLLYGVLMSPLVGLAGPYLLDLLQGVDYANAGLEQLSRVDAAIALVLSVGYAVGFYVITHWLRHRHAVLCPQCSPADVFADDDESGEVAS